MNISEHSSINTGTHVSGKRLSAKLSAVSMVLLSISLSGCLQVSQATYHPTSHEYIVEQRDTGKFLAVMLTDGSMYCLAGRGSIGTYKFRAGQCWVNGELRQFSIREFLIKFPEYNSDDRVVKEAEREDKRSVHQGSRVE